MNLLVIGGGGREHAIIRKLKENPTVETIFCLPGNGGISYDACCVDIPATNVDAIISFAEKKSIDFAIVGPDDPLSLGLVDQLTALGIPTFGPDQRASLIESSKVFSKNLMKRYQIPTADYQIFDSSSAAIAWIQSAGEFPLVVKADGLALGKGVIIAEDLAEAEKAIQSIMVDKAFGESGNRIIVEEFLTGPEVSVLSFTDGKTIVPMVSSMDHKRIYEQDKGPNTGGMGAIAPNPYYTDTVASQCMDTIFLPTIRAMEAEGRPFKGCLYFGLMLTEAGPKVIEYNCRFGDPETQVVLPLLKTDLLTIMTSVINQKLDSTLVEFEDDTACCVIAASFGYPEKYSKGFPISGLHRGQLATPSLSDLTVFHAGTKRSHDLLTTSGGRVLGVTGKGSTLKSATAAAYKGIQSIHFDGIYYRSDIGEKALSATVNKD